MMTTASVLKVSFSLWLEIIETSRHQHRSYHSTNSALNQIGKSQNETASLMMHLACKQIRRIYHNSKAAHTAATRTTILRPFVGTTRVSQYQKKHSPTHHPDHHPVFISFFHLPRAIASSLFKLCAWQYFCTTSFHALFGLPLGLEPSTSYSIHFSPNQCLLFAAHAHTIATCFAVVSILCHLF